MDRQDVIQLFKIIQDTYGNKFTVEDPGRKIDTWLMSLGEHDATKVAGNLKTHIETNTFPPTIADLVKKPIQGDRAIPNAKETQLLLQGYSEVKPADEKTRAEALAEMRKILGIKRG